MDMSGCLQDTQGNIYCPVDAPKPEAPPSVPQYAADDNLFFLPSNQSYQVPSAATAQSLPVVTLHRANSVPDLSETFRAQQVTRPQNIDKNPLQVLALTANQSPYPQSGIHQSQMAGTMNAAAVPAPYAPTPYAYSRKPVNLKRALKLAILMSCLMPPVGLCGLGAALRGRHLRYKHPKRASRYRALSYTMSVLSIILIILGIVIIVLITQQTLQV